MCSQFSGRYSPKAALVGVATALLLVLGAGAAHGQLTVEDFPDLALTDFSYVNQATRAPRPRAESESAAQRPRKTTRAEP